MQYKNKLFIDGKWLDGEGGATFDVINPASEEVITKVASAGIEDAKKAITVFLENQIDIYTSDGNYGEFQINAKEAIIFTNEVQMSSVDEKVNPEKMISPFKLK